MTDQQLHLSIIRRFRPSWGKTVRDCETCGGDGLRVRRSEGAQWDSPCPHCTGYGSVFREDQEGRELIAEALRDWLINDATWQFCYRQGYGWQMSKASRGVKYDHKIVSDSTQSSPPDLWSIRKSQPWQSALETHVRNYTPTPPDLRTPEGFWFLIALMEQADAEWAVSYEENEYEAAVRDKDRVWRYAWADSVCEALLTACQAAMKGGG